MDRFSSLILTVLAERMTRAGIHRYGVEAEPFSVVWCVLSGGKLVGFTYDQDQDVTGWHRQPIGGSGVSNPSSASRRRMAWVMTSG